MQMLRRLAIATPRLIGSPYTRALQLKLDEILRGSEGARTELVKLETMSDQELADTEAEILRLRAR